MRYVSSLLILVLLVSLGSAGCAMVSEHEKTAIGAGAGAAGGAVLGGLMSRSTSGVVVGGLLGALVGGAVGYYLERQDRTRAEAVSASAYDPARGNLVRVERARAEPAQLRPGDVVNLVATYTVLTPTADQTVAVRETREVRHGGVLVANPTTEFSRPNGTFTSALPITLPATADRGVYEVTTTVSVGERVSRGMTTFTVN
jgi:surface antigen